MTVRRRSFGGKPGGQERSNMGTIVEFPADAAARRAGLDVNVAPREGTATILILPAIRIERYADETRDAETPDRDVQSALHPAIRRQPCLPER